MLALFTAIVNHIFPLLFLPWLAATVCDEYTWNGTTYFTTGAYTYTTTNAAGCDSVATLNLIVNYSVSSSVSVTACDSYIWNNVTYTSSGIQINVTSTASGCDIVDSLVLTINNSTSSTESVTACDTYTWNGQPYSLSGLYTYYTTNAAGCDSTATLNLIINASPLTPIITQPFATTFAVTNASYTSYQWYSSGNAIAGATASTLSLTQAGWYTVMVSNASGCTSISEGRSYGGVGPPTAIDEALLEEFNLYPNPSRDIVFLQTPTVLGVDYVVEVYDYRGRIVLTYDVKDLQVNKTVIDITTYGKGIYRVIVRYANGNVWNQSLIKQ